MTLELAIEAPVSTPVELLLEEMLDREWDAQSMRAEPLAPTATVRELMELILAGAPAAAVATAAVTDGTATTPAQLVGAVRDGLPIGLSPWTLRAVRRVGALRTPRPSLPRAQALPLLTAGAPTPPPEPAVEAPPSTVPEPTPAPQHTSRAALPIVATAGAVLGAAIGAAAGALDVPGVALGAIAGLFAAAVAGGRR